MKRKIAIYYFIFTCIFIFLFSFLYIFYLNNIYTFQKGYETPIVFLIGFSFIFTLLFYFFINLRKFKANFTVLSFQFINENLLASFLMVFMALTFFFPPISFTKTLMDWNQINPFNLIRSIVFLIGSAFVPGYCIFTLLFPYNNLAKLFKIESFFLKLTIYPLLSLSFLGIFTLILDIIGFTAPIFDFVLFLGIISLFLINLFLRRFRTKNLKFKLVRISISRNTLFILLLAFGVIIIALGVHLYSKYVIPGDAYRGMVYANYIGQLEINPYDQFYELKSYNILWGYISYGLSKLTGIPFINANAMLFVFLYIFITSIYLLIKAILFNINEKYAILATLFVTLCSGIYFIFNPNDAVKNISRLLIDGIFCFRYKSFAIFLCLVSLALYIILIRNLETKREFSIGNKDRKKILILCAWFIGISTIQYFLPIFQLSILIIVFIIISRRRDVVIKISISIISYFILIFIILDIISGLFFSWIIYRFYLNFLGLHDLLEVGILPIISIIIYLFFLVFLMLLFVYKKLLKKFNFNWLKSRYNLKTVSKYIFIIYYGTFIILLIIELILKFFPNSNNFFTFYLDLIFLNIGIIGIFGIFLSFYCYKKNRTVFYGILLWFLFTFSLASILIYIRWIQFPNLSPFELPAEERYYYFMTYWFSRNWYYSVIPLSIFCAVGLIKLRKNIIVKHDFRKWGKILKKFFLFSILNNRVLQFSPKHKNNIKKAMKLSVILSFTSILIFYSFSDTIIAGIYYTNHPALNKNDDAQIFGWISENLPDNSKILIDRYQSKNLEEIPTCNIEKISSMVRLSLGSTLQIPPKCEINIIQKSFEHRKVLEIKDYNRYRKVWVKSKFESHDNGSIEFYIQTTNSSQDFWIHLISDNIYAISIVVKSNAIHYLYNNSYYKIRDIENNVWYKWKVDFECSNGNFSGLNQFHWKTIINGHEYGNYPFRNNLTQVEELELSTTTISSNQEIFLDNPKFSWLQDFEINNWIYTPIFDYLESNDVNYYLYSKTGGDYKDSAMNYIGIPDISYELVKNYFKKPLYAYENLILYQKDSLGFNCSEGTGIFNATYNFKCDINGFPPDGWKVTDHPGTTIQIIDEIGGHKKVLEIDINSIGYDMVYNYFGDKNFGSIELWIRSSNTYKNFYIVLRDENIWAADLFFANSNFNVYGTTLCNASNDKWHHVRFDFRCHNSSPYLNLDEGTYNIWINQIIRIENASLNSEADKVDNLLFVSSYSLINYQIYFDAIGYSWDPYYELGDNFN